MKISKDYYPFGMVMPGRNQVSSPRYRKGYQGQFTEHDEEVKWDAFELRMYDGRMGRWMSVDPYNEFHSPYLAMGNNPILNVDPDGGCIKCIGVAVGPLHEGFKIFRHASTALSTAKGIYNGYKAATNPVVLGSTQSMKRPTTPSGGVSSEQDTDLSEIELDPTLMEPNMGYPEIPGIGKAGSVIKNSKEVVVRASKVVRLIRNSRLRDWYRYDKKTLIPNNAINPGQTGGQVGWGIRGGGYLKKTGEYMGFQYHINRFNLYKPWKWFENAPLIKP